MIHITEEGGRKKVGLNLYRTRGGFVVAWVWYYTATHELKGWRFRLRMHMKPRILWSVDSCNVIANYLTIHNLQLVNREALAQTVMLDQTSHDAQRKPLPYEQLDSLWQTTDTGDFELDIREFARAIEAFHGIKE
jgi:hypothetical protein